MATLNTRIVLRNDSTANWLASESTILMRGEVGIEFLDNGKVKMKVGNGTSTWAELPYFGGEESHVFEATVPENGDTHPAAIAAVVGSVNPIKGDIAIVKELITGDKYSYTAYVHNGTDWAAMDGNYNAENVYFDTDMMVTKEIGYITLSNGQGMIPSKGKNLTGVFEAMFVKEQNPSKTDPSVSISLTNSGSYEVGTTVTTGYTATFEDGKYTYGPEPTGATVTEWEVTTSTGDTFTEPSGTLTDVVVTDDTAFTVTAKATHTEGVVPVTNKGNEYAAAKIASGTKSKTSSAISGFRALFYGVLSTSTAEAPLTSNIIRTQLTNGGNYNEAKAFTLNGSATAKRIVIAIPSTSTRGGLTEVILSSAMNTPITGSYVKTEKAVKVEGANGAVAVDYDVYVYEPSSIDAGEIHDIKLA